MMSDAILIDLDIFLSKGTLCTVLVQYWYIHSKGKGKAVPVL
jgi:hypothetical protein